MGHQINSYLALFIIMAVGVVAAQIIMHFANVNAFAIALGAETSYLNSPSTAKK